MLGNSCSIRGVSRVVLLERVIHGETGVSGTFRKYGRLATLAAGVRRQLLWGVFRNCCGMGIGGVLDSRSGTGVSGICLRLCRLDLPGSTPGHSRDRLHNMETVRRITESAKVAKNDGQTFCILELRSTCQLCDCLRCIL